MNATIPPRCKTCNDTGAVYIRPTVIDHVIRVGHIVEGHSVYTSEDAVTVSGGLDACPQCAAQAGAV